MEALLPPEGIIASEVEKTLADQLESNNINRVKV